MIRHARQTLLKRCRVPVEHLTVGMFVAELDRPWLDTPFPLQGMLVQHEAELEAFRRHCRYVYVEIRRSTVAVRDALRGRLEAERREMHGSRQRGVLAGITSRLRTLFVRQAPAPVAQPDPALAARAAALGLPAGLRLQRYDDPVPMEEAMPRAEQAVAHGADVLDALMEDLRSNVSPDFSRIDSAADALVSSVIENPDAIMLVSKMRESHRRTYEHGLKSALNLLALGRHLGFPRDELVHLAMIGMLADVGKTLLPRSLIEKPGMLTPDELEVVKTHVELGLSAIRGGMRLHPSVEQGILQHHERMDGSGYPRGLRGDEIGIHGRMAAVADCFAAMISERPYAPALSPMDALLRLYEWSGSLLHEPLVEQLVQAIGAFPVGSLVELSNGEVALVLARNRVRRLEPRVLVLAGPDKKALDTPFERDLMAQRKDDGTPPLKISRGLAAGDYGLALHDYYAGEPEIQDALAA